MGSDTSEMVVKNRYLSLVWGIFITLGSYWILKTKKQLVELTKFVNAWSIAMVSISLFNIGLYVFAEKNITKHSNKFDQADIVVSGGLPDIYYIVFDAYANEHTLKETFSYDNNSFLNFLKKRDFYIASKSRSNYAETLLSLNASLNMDYIDPKYLETGMELGGKN